MTMKMAKETSATSVHRVTGVGHVQMTAMRAHDIIAKVR